MYRFVIYDYENRDRIGELEMEDSVQWLEHYQEPGEVKITAQATQRNIELLVEDNRIYNTDSDTAARICQVEVNELENENIIVVRANITSILLDDRVIYGAYTGTNIEEGMRDIFIENRRDLPVAIGTAKGFAENVHYEVSGNTVLYCEKWLAELSGLGYKVIFDPVTAIETLDIYKGVDRTDRESPDYIGYFGTDAESIEKVQIVKSFAGYKNVAIVAGEGDGVARTIRTVSIGSPAGEDRRELYVDARDLTRDYQVAIDTGEVDEKGDPIFNYETRRHPEPVYLDLLDKRGLAKLEECMKSLSLTCDITQNNIIFGVDYGLGDRIPLRLPDYNVFASGRVASVNRIYERESNKLMAILNDFSLEVSQ